MLKEAIGNKFEYKRLTPEEQQKRGILGRLAGIMADFKHPTRNGRLYTEELWDKVFKDPIMQEKIQTKTVLGELGHPADRSEIDIEKVAICLAEEPQKFKDGTIRGVFDILDTPCGRILKTLCDYGVDIGISSRGEGDLIESWSGEQQVDPNTYSCECWDAVLLPAVKSARLTPVNESLQNKSLSQSLTEAINKASVKDKKIMVDLLESLKIDYKPVKKVDNKNIAAEDIGADVVKDLQESIKQNNLLQKQLKEAQEKLSVCNAKEIKLTEACDQQAKSFESIKGKLESRIESLTEKLNQSAITVEKQGKQIKLLSERCKTQLDSQKSLNESLSSTEAKINSLRESLKTERENSIKKVSSLNESLEELKQDSLLLKQSYEKKLKRAETMVEHYKKVAITASNKYIEFKAKMIGVNSSEIKNRLNEGYSFGDIDRVCNDLQEYNLKVNSLPFDVSQGKNLKVKIKESYEPIKPKNRFDDELDPSLINLANKY